MQENPLDKEILARFPGATFVARKESVVIRAENKAIHVYPPEYPRPAIELLAREQNGLAKKLVRADVRVAIGDKSVPVRATRIQEVDQLRDGRVFTEMQFDVAPNLTHLELGKAQPPKWIAPQMRRAVDTDDIVNRIGKSIVTSLGAEHVPFEFQLHQMNVHVRSRSFNIVDIAADVYRFVINARE